MCAVSVVTYIINLCELMMTSHIMRMKDDCAAITLMAR